MSDFNKKFQEINRAIAEYEQERTMPARGYQKNPYDKNQIESDFNKIAEVIRVTSLPTLDSARTATELVLYAQDQRRKAGHAEKAITWLEYGGTVKMVDRVLTFFRRSPNDGESGVLKFPQKEAMKAALEIVAGGHMKNAELAESMVKVQKPEIES